MSKESGLGARYAYDGYDLSNDTQMFGNIDKTMQLLEVPGIDVSAMERITGELDGAINWKTYFNPSALKQHAALKGMPRTDRIASYWHRSTIGTPVASLVVKQFSYSTGREKNGMLLGDVKTMADASWLDWGYGITAYGRTDTTATNGAGVDFGDPTPGAYNFGLQAYLQVSAFSGTTCTIKLQSSTDNGGTDAFSDVIGGAFTAVTGGAPLSQKISTARDQTVERYQRVVTSGTFTSITFSVAVVLNITDMTI